MKVLEEAFKKKVAEINEGERLRVEKLEQINFVKNGRESSAKSKKKLKPDKRWKGVWKIAIDLDTLLVFPLVATEKRPDLVI